VSDPGRQKEIAISRSDVVDRTAGWPTEKHEMSLENPYNARNGARDRCPSHPPRAIPAIDVSLADGGRLAP
jgi:hypothetical protein